MITEDYVSFEVAKLLKEKWFNEPCFALYNPEGVLIPCGIRLNNTQVERVPGSYSAPTLQMAMKWLRKNHKIHIDIDYIDLLEDGEVWSAKIVDMVTFKETKIESTWNYYEQACEAVIRYTLKNLIQ